MLLTRRAAGVSALGLLAGLALAALYFRLDPARYPFPRCLVQWLTGLHCPGCGTQRALHALLHGHVAQAIGFNLLAALYAPVVVCGLLEEARHKLTAAPRRLTFLQHPWFGWGTVAVVVLFTVLRNLPVPLGVWLAP